MTPDCNFDTASTNVGAGENPSDFFEQHSDCWSDCSTGGCPSGQAGDDVCIDQCDMPLCGYDLGDCAVCNSDCSASQLGDGICDEACNTFKCNLDNGDCGFCSNDAGNTCDSAKLTNDTCDNECMSYHCDFDKNACGGDYCNSDKTCHTSMIDNGMCDEACRSEESCNFDGEDCGCAPGCDKHMLGDGVCQESCNNQGCSFDQYDCDHSPIKRALAVGDTDDNPTVFYVLGGSADDSTPRTGTATDPHRSLTGTLASLLTKYTVIKLLGSHHTLSNFEKSAFPDSIEDYDPKSPFKDLTEDREIVKVIIKPEFCSEAPDMAQCVPDDTQVPLELPSTQLTFDFGFAVEFHDVKFDGQNQLAFPNTSCAGEFCTYCPDVTIEDSQAYDDYGNLMDTPYRSHCADWHSTDLFEVSGASGSLYLENVSFFEIRAQYSSLIYMYNSSNLNMQNTHFEKVQTLAGVVTIEDDEMQCPSTGCETVIMNNCSVKFMNYGYNLTSELALSSFLYIKAEKVALEITQSSFEYNIVLSGAIFDFSKLKQLTLEDCFFQYNIGGADASALYIKS